MASFFLDALKNFVTDFDPLLASVAFMLAFAFTIYYQTFAKPPTEAEVKIKPNKRNKTENFVKLQKHTEEFNKPEIISICDNSVHVAIGYGLANAIILEGDDGCVLIDTLESIEAAQELLFELRKNVTQKGIVAIILTHFHADHTQVELKYVPKYCSSAS